MSRLRRINHLCSRTVSNPANGLLKRTDSEGSSSVAEKKSSAVPLFRSGRRSPIFARLSQRKGVIHKRVETLVSTLLCPCRAGKIRSLRKRQTFVYNDLTNPRFDFRTHAKNKTPPCRCSPISNLHDSCRWVLCLIPLRFQLPCIPGRPAAQYQNFPKSRTKNVG